MRCSVEIRILALLWLVAAAGCTTSGPPPWMTQRAPSAQSLAQAPPLPRNVSPGNTSPSLGLTSDERQVVRLQDADEDADLLSLERISDFSPSKMFDGLRQKTPWRRDEEMARGYLGEAEQFYRQNQYEEAAAKFKKAAFRWPNSVLEEDALFYLGECYFFLDKYPKASDTYAQLIKKYSNTRHLDIVSRRQFQIARYWLDLDRTDHQLAVSPNWFDRTRPWFNTKGNAISAYTSIWTSDPTGPLADDAVIATANQYFVDSSWNDADYYYELLRDNHPQSEHLVQAYSLGLQSKLRTYQGPEYDPTPLNKSQVLVDQMLTQFGGELGSERERVVAARAHTRELQAQRYWYLGEYYSRGKYYGAVRNNLNRVVKEFPDTSFAAKAQQRLQEIAGEPDQPTKPLDWVVELLPESAR